MKDSIFLISQIFKDTVVCSPFAMCISSCFVNVLSIFPCWGCHFKCIFSFQGIWFYIQGLHYTVLQCLQILKMVFQYLRRLLESVLYMQMPLTLIAASIQCNYHSASMPSLLIYVGQRRYVSKLWLNNSNQRPLKSVWWRVKLLNIVFNMSLIMLLGAFVLDRLYEIVLWMN